MKKLMAVLLLAGSTQGVYAQKAEKKEMFLKNKSLYGELANIQKKTNRFNLYLNVQGSFDTNFCDSFGEGVFRMRQLRTGAKGNLNSWLFCRYRQRSNRSNEGGGMIDNIPTSVNYAEVGVKLNNQLSFLAGKQCAVYRGFEFDLNPIDIYEYSDMVDSMSNFMTGLNISYNITPIQQLNLQILNSRSNSFDRTCGITKDSEDKLSDLKSGEMPLVYTLNWNGNFNEAFKTHWSTSVMSEAKDKNLCYYAMGNELSLDEFNIFVDFMCSQEGIDRGGTITGIVGDASEHNAFNAGYLFVVTKLNYRFLPRWNASIKGMYEAISVAKAADGIGKGNYHTSWGYLAGVGFYPMKTDLYFFLTYVGCSYDFIYRAKVLGQENCNTSRLSLGFIYQLPMF